MSEDSRLDPLRGWLFEASLATMALVAVGLLNLTVGKSIGTGLQPAYAFGAVLLLTLLIRRDGPRLGGMGFLVLAALAWTWFGLSGAWNFDELGLAGEVPWSKSLKQAIMLTFLTLLACAPAVLLARSQHPWSTLRRWERAASAGLFAVSIYGLFQAVSFYLVLPGAEFLDELFRSNPSIAAGSEELYLGHRFIGIPRVRSTAAEPLYFGSYLLAVVPITLAGAWTRAGYGRLWRGVAIILASTCLILTFSRGVYLALGVQLLLLYLGVRRGLLPSPPRRLVLSLIGVGFAVVTLAGLLAGQAPWALPQLLIQRLAQSFVDHDMSNLTRLFSWQAATQLAFREPLTGIGWGNFGFWYYRILPDGGGAAAFGWPVTNSVPLRFLAETGLIGALLWMGVVLQALMGLRVGRTMGGRAGAGGGVLVFLLASCVAAMCVQTLTFSQLNLPHLWILGGCSAAVYRERERLV